MSTLVSRCSASRPCPSSVFTATTEPLLGANPEPVEHRALHRGSSGGASALVAAGIPIAHANDGGGSIRIPAACCGVVGLKPTRGRVVGRRRREAAVNITANGVVTRSVRDTALFYSEREAARTARATSDWPRHLPRQPAALRWCSARGHVRVPGGCRVQGDRAGNCRHLWNLGHHVESFPFHSMNSSCDFLRYWAGLAFERSSTAGKQMFGEGFNRASSRPLINGRFFRTVAPTNSDHAARLRQFGDQYERVFESHDVLLSPVLSHRRLDRLSVPGHRLQYPSGAASQVRLVHRRTEYLRCPAISYLGFSEDGLPIRVQASAGFSQEARLLELALELEEAMPWR